MDRTVSKAYTLITKLQKKYGFKTKGFIVPIKENNNNEASRCFEICKLVLTFFEDLEKVFCYSMQIELTIILEFLNIFRQFFFHDKDKWVLKDVDFIATLMLCPQVSVDWYKTGGI